MGRYFYWLMLSAVLTCIAACSAGHAPNPAPEAAADIAELTDPDGAVATLVRDGDYKLRVYSSSFEPGGTAEFELSVSDNDGTSQVAVSASRAQGLRALYCDLEYDSALRHPVLAGATGQLGADVLELAILSEPGVVHLGQVLPNWDRRAGLTGSAILAVIGFAPGPALQTIRQASKSPTDEGSRGFANLSIEARSISMRYFSKGDYDQNGEVNASDLTPLGLHFGAPGPYDINEILSIVDGDGNGEINAADITPIGLNFGNLITGFNVYGSADPNSDYPAAPDEASSISPLGFIPLSSFDFDSPEYRKSYYFNLGYYPGPLEVFWYRPTDGPTEGIPSSRTDQPNGHYDVSPLVYFTFDKDYGDAPLTVNFDASASYDPDGPTLLNFFVSGESGEESYFMSPFSASPMIQYTFSEPGNFVTKVNASDGYFGSASAPVLITVLDNGNAVPTAVLVIQEPRNGAAPHTVTLDLSGSSDPESAVLHYEFDVCCYNIETVMPRDDYEQDNLNNPVYQFTAVVPGYYEVVGRVTDGDGHSNADYAGQFTVTDNGNQPPYAGIVPSVQSGTAPLTVNFTTNDWSLSDKDGSIASAEIDPEGNQTWINFNPLTGYSYVYTTPGQYHPRLRATDDQGLIGYSSPELTIFVN